MPRIDKRTSDMLAITWVLLSTLAAHHVSCLAPPVPAAIDTPAETDPAHSSSTPLALPEKRLFTYLLPASHWGDGTLQEGAKRGYGKNYLRFGRSEDDKRGGRNFLRFGRGDSSDYDVSESDELASGGEMDKRDRNFLRFGRGPNNNFLRFGRSGSPSAYAQGLEMQPAGEVVGDEGLTSEEKRAGRNYLRFGRSKNFIRYVRGDNRNFLRFGRSVDNQLPCEGCHSDDVSANSPPATTTTTTTTTRAKRAAVMPSEDNDNDDDAKGLQRIKRSSMRFNTDYSSAPSASFIPAAWAREYQPEDSITSDESSLEESMKKRNYERNFLRFGRNRNYLRFGKRDTVEDVSADSSSSSSNDNSVMAPDEFSRYVRGQQKNFLRFG